ncbi:putative pseudouridine synthase [Selenomonas ruminantium subsp. lactilytica TAM6421]|uniref:Pseudouridine synthase n=1 Tax=Selenomonas ruminantium subsp. lactilytica (strain NBRC 103574 / TAM6421) TaxID=927704 RepID=I0GQ29_SELRL|nr:RluA family pseudouridine synthase [Selenomonas ruminantium]BAL82866.1 putative pseudouridine synthase [Selenomonas ruminantium subsp. lactilytica TAM6421]
MTRIEVTLADALTSMPVRAFLKANQGISNTIWKRIKNSGTFAINGEICNAARSEVKTGDIITYDILRPSDIAAEDLPLDIRYEDEWLLVINKPAGQLVHPTTQESHGTVGNALMHYFAAKSEAHAFHPVHRLDRDTSGLLLVAKEPQIQYLLSPKGCKNFKREYQAIIEGKLTPADGIVDAPIARSLPSIILRKVSPEGQDARTHYRTVKTNGKLSLIELELETGRTHQIRVHMAHLGHPLLGDDLYGGNMDLIQRQALHAFRLSFRHPMTQKELVITTPPPADFLQITASLDRQ